MCVTLNESWWPCLMAEVKNITKRIKDNEKFEINLSRLSQWITS